MHRCAITARLHATARTFLLGSLAGLCLFAAPSRAGDLYGNIRLVDVKKKSERPIDRRVRLVVETDTRRIEALSHKDATYYLTVPEEGACTVHLHYKGMELSAEISSFYSPNRYDLYVQTLDGKYRLRARFIKEWHVNPDDKDR